MRLVSESPLFTQERDQTGVSHNKVTRPLVLCPILFEQRYGRAEPWQVAVTANGLLQPRAPRKAARLEQVVKRHRAAGVRCRLGLALITPDDFRRRLRHSNASFTHEQSPSHLPRSDNWQPRLRSDIYGWSLLYQLPSMQGVALIDAHESFTDLPAFYESPLELLDRSSFLAARGISTRPIALVTRPEDFEVVENTAEVRNKFLPNALFCCPCPLNTFL